MAPTMSAMKPLDQAPRDEPRDDPTGEKHLSRNPAWVNHSGPMNTCTCMWHVVINIYIYIYDVKNIYVYVYIFIYIV